MIKTVNLWNKSNHCKSLSTIQRTERPIWRKQRKGNKLRGKSQQKLWWSGKGTPSGTIKGKDTLTLSYKMRHEIITIKIKLLLIKEVLNEELNLKKEVKGEINIKKIKTHLKERPKGIEDIINSLIRSNLIFKNIKQKKQ